MWPQEPLQSKKYLILGFFELHLIIAIYLYLGPDCRLNQNIGRELKTVFPITAKMGSGLQWVIPRVRLPAVTEQRYGSKITDQEKK